MYCLKAQYFPNKEIRAILSEVHVSRFPHPEEDGAFFSHESHRETHDTEGSLSSSSSLTLGANSKLPNCRPGYGCLPRRTKFGNRARRTLLRVGGAMDHLEGGHKKCIFFTGTLPGSSDESMRAIAEWSAYLTHRWKAWIAKKIKAKYDYYCWELQKRGALHFHYCIYIEDDVLRTFLRNKMKGEWVKLLQEVCRKSGIDLFARASGGTWASRPEKCQAYAQECRKSVAAYLSKYLSKQKCKEGGKYAPSRWWGVSRPLRAFYRSLCVEKIWYFVRRHEAESEFEEILHSIESGCAKSYAYGCKHGARVVTGYGEIWDMQDLQKLLPRKYAEKSSARSLLLGLISQELRSAAEFSRMQSTRYSRQSFASVEKMRLLLKAVQSSTLVDLLELADQLRSRLYCVFRGDSMEPIREAHIKRTTKAWILMSKMWRRADLDPQLSLEDAINNAPEGWIHASIKYWRDDGPRSAPNFADFN